MPGRAGSVDKGERVQGEPTGETRSRLRLLNLRTVIGSISAVGALLVAIDAGSWQAAVLLAVGLAAALLVARRWAVGRYSPLALLGLAVTAAVWLVAALAADAPSGIYAFAVVATVVAFEVPRLRWVLVAVAGASVVAIVAVRLAVVGDGAVEVLLRYAVVMPCTATPGVVLTVLAYAVHNVIGELERAQEHEAELAVMRERVRFAGDLHDIQGHTLHVVRLKVALAKRLLEDGRGDPERAEAELDEVHGLVGDTIARTKDLAYAQRRLNFSAELENAKNLFEAAGIRVGWSGQGRSVCARGRCWGRSSGRRPPTSCAMRRPDTYGSPSRRRGSRSPTTGRTVRGRRHWAGSRSCAIAWPPKGEN